MFFEGRMKHFAHRSSISRIAIRELFHNLLHILKTEVNMIVHRKKLTHIHINFFLELYHIHYNIKQCRVVFQLFSFQWSPTTEMSDDSVTAINSNGICFLRNDQCDRCDITSYEKKKQPKWPSHPFQPGDIKRGKTVSPYLTDFRRRKIPQDETFEDFRQLTLSLLV